MGKAKAIVFRSANTPTLEEIEYSALRPGELLFKTHFSGVSIGTESSIFSGVRTQNGTFPLVPGYMASGVIEELAGEYPGFAVGDRIITASGSRLEGGIHSVWGAHASKRVVACANVLKIPAGVDSAEAALFVLPAVGLNAVAKCGGVTEQDIVVIVGQGLIGQCFGQFCRSRGARVIVLEPNETRAGLSREYVTEHVLHPADPQLDERVGALTGGKGASVVVEATASAKNIAFTTRFLRSGSRMVFLSWYPGDITIPFAPFHNNAVTAYFPMGYGNMETRRAVLEALAAGVLKIGKNITHRPDYREACAGYEALIRGDRSVMGMVIDWRSA